MITARHMKRGDLQGFQILQLIAKTKVKVVNVWSTQNDTLQASTLISIAGNKEQIAMFDEYAKHYDLFDKD